MSLLSRSIVLGLRLGAIWLGIANTVAALGQSTAQITGLITDPTGAVIPGAKIKLTDLATGIEMGTTTDGSGLYVLGGLRASTYTLRARAKGFAVSEQSGIPVDVSSTTKIDLILRVGTEAQTFTVGASALAPQADSNVLSTVVTSDQIAKIATENRNFAALAVLGLGVSSALPDNNVPTAVSSSFEFSVNGLRQSHNIWLIDGGESDDRGAGGGMAIMPSQEAVAEFMVLSSNYPPDYGISSGATLSLSLKSGTARYHGELFEFNRNTAYDANSYFNKLSTPVTPRPRTNYDIFGFNLGGPVAIPYGGRQRQPKTFFFWNEEWRKLLSSAGSNVQNTIDPADIPKAGQNLTYVAPGFDPQASIVVPNISTASSYYREKLQPLGLLPGHCWNGPALLDGQGNMAGCAEPQVIPASLFDSDGVLYLNSPVFPKPNVAGQDKNISNVSTPIDVRDDLVRVDRKISDKWTIMGHFIHDQVSQQFATAGAQLAWAVYNTIQSSLQNPSYSAAVAMTAAIRPGLLVETSFNFDGNIVNIANNDDARLPAGWTSTPVSSAFKPTRNALPGIGFISPYGVAEDTGSAPWHNAAQDYEPRVDVTAARNRHVMKYGFSYNRYVKNQQIFGDSQGYFNPSSTTNDSLIDLLLGLAGSYSQFQATPIRHYVNETPSVYAMDNWRVNPRLNLQLGLRFDALPHAWERNNAVSNFDPLAYDRTALPNWTAEGTIDPSSPSISIRDSVPYYLNGVELAGAPGTSRGLVNNRYNTLQPRVGFSLDLSRTGTTVLRGGFGTFYERVQGNDIYGAASNPPFAYNLSLPNPYLSSPGTNWQTGQSAAALGFPIFAASLSNLAKRNYAPPGVAMYSLGLQRQIAPSVLWVMQYVGNAAWHQWDARQINNIPPGTGNVAIPEPDGSRATVAISCLAGDPSNLSPYGDDSLCTPGFQSFAGGQNQFLTFQGYGAIQQQEMASNGNYSALQTGIRVQNRWGMSGEANYTWSHEIDIQSFDGNCCVSNPWSLKYDKGSGALDRRHIFSADASYHIPFHAQSRTLLHAVAGGWSIAGTLIAESGLVQTLTRPVASIGDTYDPVGLGGGYAVRPNIQGKAHYPHKWQEWFDTSQLSNVVPVWQGGPNLGFGNAGKDAIVGPGRFNLTMSLYKSFALYEHAHFELRFESFNTFNHSEAETINTSYAPQNGPFSTILNQGNTFGQVTGSFDPRVLELGARLTF